MKMEYIFIYLLILLDIYLDIILDIFLRDLWLFPADFTALHSIRQNSSSFVRTQVSSRFQISKSVVKYVHVVCQMENMKKSYALYL
jgi:hypothetical protein